MFDQSVNEPTVTTMDEKLLTFVANFTDAGERSVLAERLRTDPTLQRDLYRWQRLVGPLAADGDEPEVPADLAQRTIDFVCAPMNHGELPPALADDCTPIPADRLKALVEVLDRRTMAGPTRLWRWDVVAVSVLLFLGIGLALAAVPFLRQRHDRLACQNRMRELHRGLETYSDLHDGQYPQVREQPPFNTAASFVNLLREAGVVSTEVNLNCPANPAGPTTYAYSLGYRDAGGQLLGLARSRIASDQDYLPILADRPMSRTGNGVNPEHRYGQNVLFVDGHVRFCTTTKAGVAGDEIYVNKFGQVGAGVHLFDTSLGYAGDQP